MKRLKFCLLLVACAALFALAACGTRGNEGDPPAAVTPNENGGKEEDAMTDVIFLTIGSDKNSVKLEENAATAALVELLKEGDITYTAHSYGGFEMVGALGHALPRDDRQMTTEAGDVILYSGDQIVLFYGANSWSYTRLGKMQGLSSDELRAILTGSDPVTVTISLQ